MLDGQRGFGLRKRRERTRPERGAAIVEMALLLPILLMLVLGVFELGAVFKSYLTTSNAAREGTRLLSARGTDELADCLAVVKAVEALTLANNLDDLEYIEIFEARPSDGSDVPGTVNRNTYAAGDPADCTPTPGTCGSWTCTVQQPPASRSALVGASTSPDLIGMRIVYTHRWLSGFPPFRGSVEINEQTISRLEPEGFA